jgi:coenzyme F420 hydrogenase subunit beta
MSPPRSPTVSRVLRGQLCTGCGLCASVSQGAITMQAAPPGYSRPVQTGPLTEAAERTIAQACPGVVVQPWSPGPNLHPYWGPWRRIATGHASDESIRFRGSSGGVVTALAVHALQSGAVDRVAHVVADPSSPTRNVMACSTSAAEISEGAGSRYSASSPLGAIDQMLSDGGAVAIVGKPCDISALRRLAQVDPRVERHVRYALSFFCAGIPSHRAAGRVLAAMGVEPDDLVGFRYRGRGWPGKAAAQTRDGRLVEMSYAESWGEHLSKEIQFRCKICPDAVGGVADIACADPWYGDEDGFPIFDENGGRSMIITRTAAGDALVDSAIAAGQLSVEPLDVAEIERMQPSQARRKRLVASRMAALAVTLQPRPEVGGAEVAAAARRARVGEKLRSFLGAVRRIIIRRR